MKRREFLARATAATCLATSACVSGRFAHSSKRPPNILFVITDDQGYGDLGVHGNPYMRTPNLDRLHGESVRFGRFYVSPVCSPTRACLMTGRYNYRTGVVDTFQGRSMMYPEEITLAEALSSHGYATGIFGKWHLGDHCPMRPQDQGFREVLVHHGGGIGQPSDPPGSGYFNPILQHNGRLQQYEGYCTDVFADEAIAFMEANRHQPFFAYLATNAPHSPLEIGHDWVEPYRAQGLDEKVAKVYGMVANVDANVGKVLARLASLGLENDTVVIFMTDNGPQFPPERFNAGMRGSKGTVYEGGIRVPCFIRWPGGLRGGQTIAGPAAHVDLFPTLLDLCGVPVPDGAALDGHSLMYQLRREAPWPERTLYLQWHRGDAPELFRNCAAVSTRYKLVEGRELYDRQADPAEERDLAKELPDVVARMREGCEAWFVDVSSTRGYDPPRIFLGTRDENPVTLTRQDWRGTPSWHEKDVGYWEVSVIRSDEYDVRVEFTPTTSALEQCTVELGPVKLSQSVPGEAGQCTFRTRLPAGPATLRARIEGPGGVQGASFVHVSR